MYYRFCLRCFWVAGFDRKAEEHGWAWPQSQTYWRFAFGSWVHFLHNLIIDDPVVVDYSAVLITYHNFIYLFCW